MANSDKNIRITTSKNKTTFPNIVFTGSSAGTSVLTLEVRDDNTVAFTGLDGDVFALDYNLSTGTIWSVNDKSGTPFLRASAGGTIGIAEFGTGVLVGIGQTNPKYKLDVQGWAGFASTGDGSYTVLLENGLSVGNNALSIRSANSIRLYNSGNSFYTGFKASSASANVTYTLPGNVPATGTSVLQSDTSGNLIWVAMTAGGGSGSVNSGTANYAAYYASSTNAVSQNANLQFTGSGVSIGGNINSTSTISGSVYVYGGLGVTGNAFIGGTVYIPSTTASNISNLLVSNNTATTSTTSGALVVTGGAGIANSAFIGGMLRVGSNSFTKSYSLGDIALDNGSAVDTPAITFYFGNNLNLGTDVYSDGVGSTRYRLVYNLNETSGREVFTVDTNANLRLYNSGGGNYFGLRFAGSATTTYTLPASTPAGTAVSVLQSDQAGNMSWVAMTAGGGSGSVNSGTATYAAYYASTTNAVSENANLQFTGTGVSIGGRINSTSTTTGSIYVYGGLGITGNAFIGGTVYIPSTTASNISNLLVSNNTATASTTSGALVVSGGLGLAGNAFIGGTTTITNTTASTSSDSGALVTRGGAAVGQSLSVGGSLNIFNGANYTGFKFAGSANTTYTLPPRTPTGTATSYLSSGIDGTMAWVAAPTSGGSGAVNSGTATYAAYYATTTNAVNENANLQFTGTGLSVGGNINSTSTSTGSIYVWGGLGISGNAFIGGTAYIPSTTASNISNLLVSNSTVSTSTSSGALVVTGGVGIGGSLFTGTGSSSSISGVVLANGNVAATTYNKLTLSTPANTATLTLANNSTLATSGAFSLTLTTTAASNVTFPTAGTLVTTGNDLSVLAATTSAQLAGVISDETGTAGKLVFSTSPTFSTSVITDSTSFDVFNATATTVNAFGAATALNLGQTTGKTTVRSTDNSTSTSTGAFVVTGGSAVGQTLSVGGNLNIFNGSNYTGFKFAGSANTTYTLPPRTPTGTGTSFLSAGIDGVMAWVAAPTSGGPSGTINSSTAGKVAYYSGSTTISGDTFYYFDYNAATGRFLLANADTEAVPNSSTLFLGVGTGATNFAVTGFRKTLAAFITNNSWTDGDLLVLGVAGAGSTQKFAVDYRGYTQIGVPGTGFTLPVTNGTSGQVLTANTNGIASWTTVTGSSGAGSGTVAIPGAQYQVAAYYWSATGASVSGSSTFTNNTATGTVNITHTTPSSSTSTGALVVSGSVGLGGSLFIGNQITQTFSPSIGAGSDHALFMQSNPIATSIGAVIQIGSANKWDGTTAGFFTGNFNGTFIGINAALGNTADFIEFQENGVPVFSVGAGGTNMQVGASLPYSTTNILASFASSTNSFNQLIVQNQSTGTSASADFVINNNLSTDTTFYGNLGMNSSNFSGTGSLSLPNAVYLTSTSGPLVLGTTTADPIRFVINGGATDILYIDAAGTAISCFANLGLRGASDLRFWNAGSTLYGGIQGGNYTGASYILTMPTSAAAGFSALVTGSDGQMYFVAPGSGIAFSAATANTPTIRVKNSYNLVFCSGFTPAAAGADTVILRIPESPSDGTTSITYNLRRFQVRVETPSAGSSRLQLERSSTDTGAFTLAASGSSHIGGLGVTISGAGIYLTSVTTFSGSLVTSGNLLRLNWTLLNATHANYSVNLLLEEV